MKPLAAHSQSWGNASVPANDQSQLCHQVPWAETPPAPTHWPSPSVQVVSRLEGAGSPLFRNRLSHLSWPPESQSFSPKEVKHLSVCGNPLPSPGVLSLPLA